MIRFEVLGYKDNVGWLSYGLEDTHDLAAQKGTKLKLDKKIDLFKIKRVKCE